MEDERVLASVDFGFGYQDPKFGGTVDIVPYHADIMMANPDIYLDGKLMSSSNTLADGLGSTSCNACLAAGLEIRC